MLHVEHLLEPVLRVVKATQLEGQAQDETDDQDGDGHQGPLEGRVQALHSDAPFKNEGKKSLVRVAQEKKGRKEGRRATCPKVESGSSLSSW